MKKAFSYIGVNVEIVSSGVQLENASYVVLPGVGAFGDGMNGLQNRDFITAINKIVNQGKPLLGICLGAQLLLDKSYEFGEHSGLGLINGVVQKIPDQCPKVPHVGWAKVLATDSSDWQGTPLSETLEGCWGYFVHSYHAVPNYSENLLAICHYNHTKINAAVRKDNVFGFQFHPEKSGRQGLMMLKQFINL